MLSKITNNVGDNNGMIHNLYNKLKTELFGEKSKEIFYKKKQIIEKSKEYDAVSFIPYYYSAILEILDENVEKKDGYERSKKMNSGHKKLEILHLAQDNLTMLKRLTDKKIIL